MIPLAIWSISLRRAVLGWCAPPNSTAEKFVKASFSASLSSAIRQVEFYKTAFLYRLSFLQKSFVRESSKRSSSVSLINLFGWGGDGGFGLECSVE